MPTPQYVTLTPGAPVAVDLTDVVPRSGALVKVTTDDSATDHVYFRTDGAAAAVAAAGCEIVPAGGRSYETASINRGHNALTGADGAATVSLVCAGTAFVKVEVLQ